MCQMIKLLFFNELFAGANNMLGMVARRIGHDCPSDPGKMRVPCFILRVLEYQLLNPPVLVAVRRARVSGP